MMAKFLVEVECPEGYEPAYGKESYRCPKEGDQFVSIDGVVVTCRCDWSRSEGNRLIVRPVWQWPKWLKARWIAMSRSGEWFAYEHEPRLYSGNWITDRGQHRHLSASCMFDFTPPPCDGYRSSLRHNPYLEMDE